MTRFRRNRRLLSHNNNGGSDLLSVALAVRRRFLPHISEDEWYRKLREGLLPGVRIGRRWYISESALRAFIANGGRALPGGWRREAKQPVSASP
jgi:hypothetical protein